MIQSQNNDEKIQEQENKEQKQSFEDNLVQILKEESAIINEVQNPKISKENLENQQIELKEDQEKVFNQLETRIQEVRIKKKIFEDSDQLNQVIPQIHLFQQQGQRQLQQIESHFSQQYTQNQQTQENIKGQLSPDELDYHQLMLQAANDRKHSNFNLLREWDFNRAQFLNLHRNVIEQINGAIDQLILQATNHLRLIINFFTLKAKQETDYCRTPIPKPSFLYQKLNNLNPAFKDVKCIMENFDIQNLNHQTKVSKFADVINSDILLNNLQNLTNQSFTEYNTLRNQILKVIDDLVLLTKKTQLKSQNLANLYYKNQQEKNIHHAKKDSFKVQLGFLRAAEQQTEIQRILGRFSIQFWELGLKQELLIGEGIQKSLKDFQSGFEECYGAGIENLNQQIVDLKIDENLIKLQYAVENILGKSLNDEVKKFMNLEELKWNDIKDFLINFQLTEFENRILVLKQLDAAREFAPQVYKECKVVITADHYMLLFDKPAINTQQQSGNIKFKKPTVSIQFKSVSMKKLGQALLEMIISTNDNFLGKWIHQKESFVLKFRSDDELEEFVQVVENF